MPVLAAAADDDDCCWNYRETDRQLATADTCRACLQRHNTNK